jgi:hypothetical protein
MGIEPHVNDRFAESSVDGELLARIRTRAAEIVSGLGDEADARAAQRSATRPTKIGVEKRSREIALDLSTSIEEPEPDKIPKLDAATPRLADPEDVSMRSELASAEPPKDVVLQAPISNGSMPFIGEMPGPEQIRKAISDLPVPSITALSRDELYALVRLELIGGSSLRKSQRLEFDQAFDIVLGDLKNGFQT